MVGHQLTALALALEVAVHRADGPAREHVQRARTLATELLGDRTAVGELRDRPAALREALHQIVVDLPLPEVHLDLEEGLSVDGERVAALIRCVQELHQHDPARPGPPAVDRCARRRGRRGGAHGP